MSNVDKIQQAIIDGASLEEALEMAKGFEIEAHIEDDLLVLDGVIFTVPEGGDIEESKASSLEEALEDAWAEEAAYRGPDDLPTVVAVKAFHPAFTIWGALYDYAPQWKIQLLEEEEPPCSESEHEWVAPFEVVGGIPDNPGVWANTCGGASITQVCSHCGLTKYVNTLWQDPATGTVWENVARYDSQAYREAALQWAAKQEA